MRASSTAILVLLVALVGGAVADTSMPRPVVTGAVEDQLDRCPIEPPDLVDQGDLDSCPDIPDVDDRCHFLRDPDVAFPHDDGCPDLQLCLPGDEERHLHEIAGEITALRSSRQVNVISTARSAARGVRDRLIALGVPARRLLIVVEKGPADPHCPRAVRFEVASQRSKM